MGSDWLGGELPDSMRQQLKDVLGVDIDLRFIKTQCRIGQGNLDRELMTPLGFLKSELLALQRHDLTLGLHRLGRHVHSLTADLDQPAVCRLLLATCPNGMSLRSTMSKWMAVVAFALVVTPRRLAVRPRRPRRRGPGRPAAGAGRRRVAQRRREESSSCSAKGYAAAIVDPRVMRAMTGGAHGRIAVVFVEWASEFEQRVVIDWTIVGSESEAQEVSERMRAAARSFWGRTSISAAIDFSMALLARSPFQADRRVIDVSGDGTNNSGRDVTAARDAAIAQGVTINGLVILSDVPLPTNPSHTHPPGGLTAYYENNVIGGPGAFVRRGGELRGVRPVASSASWSRRLPRCRDARHRSSRLDPGTSQAVAACGWHGTWLCGCTGRGNGLPALRYARSDANSSQPSAP